MTFKEFVSSHEDMEEWDAELLQLTGQAGEMLSRGSEVETISNMYEPGCTLEHFCSCLRSHGAVLGRLAVEFGLNLRIMYWPAGGEEVPVGDEWDYRWTQDWHDNWTDVEDARFDTESKNWGEGRCQVKIAHEGDQLGFGKDEWRFEDIL
jgi:hypothetical protein